ncbi:hypothetical protein, partial [Bradyrhizobium ivorense]|uniref:hypothetical protein n=1 Tax=Bradyrhizobium ivorense TaxID=2511166 RepID=UPI001E2B7437
NTPIGGSFSSHAPKSAIAARELTTRQTGRCPSGTNQSPFDWKRGVDSGGRHTNIERCMFVKMSLPSNTETNNASSFLA